MPPDPLPEPTPKPTDEGMLCGCGHYHLPGTVCGKWWRYPDVQDARECGCSQWWAPTQINPIPPEQNRDPAVTRDAYLERIDDRINWRLTHVSLPVADVKYLFSTIEAMEADLETSDLLVDNAEEAYKEAGQELVRRHVRIGQLDATVNELTDLILRLDWQNIHTHYGHTDCEDCEIVADLRFRFSEGES